MLQLNNSYARSFVSVDEGLQSGLLLQSVGLDLLGCMSLACSLSLAVDNYYERIEYCLLPRGVTRSSGHDLNDRRGLYIHRVWKKDLRFSLNNFNTFKRCFTIFCTYHPEDTFYWQHVKFALEIHWSLRSADVIMTSSKMQFWREGDV